MRAVILGGTGNISTSIVRQLLEKGYDVACYNRGRSDLVPKDVRQITGDRNDRDLFEKTMRKENFDIAIDMISYTADDAASSIAAFCGVKHFIQCSTTCAYGIDNRWLPVSEDHPLVPCTEYGRGKAAADRLLLEAYYSKGFPVTIVRPSVTYGPKIGVLRQIAWEFSWIDRIRKGKPILICGDGKALMQFMHVDDAARGFVGIIGKEHCIGQVYNLAGKGCTTWEQHHETAMKVLGRNVEIIGIPLKTLISVDKRRFSVCEEIFAHNSYYSSDKIYRDVPEFRPQISLEDGMRQVFDYMDRNGMIPDSDNESWEDRLIESQLSVGRTAI